MFIILECRHRPVAHADTSCVKEEGKIRNSSSIRWTFFQFPSTSSRREDLTATDVGKSQETEYYLANQLKKKCKKKEFQGIHDRFLLDNAFRVRMIENNRDEEACRRWDVLADKVTLIICQKNTSTTRTSGGPISISRVLIPYH